MAKHNCKNIFISGFISAVFLLVCFFIFPFAAQAFDSGSLYENKPVQGGEPLYYADAENNNYWVVSDEKWHECIYDNAGYDKIIGEVRTAMYNRTDACTVYFALDKKENPDSINTIFDIINKQVYNDDKAPYGGDYLKFMSTISLNENSGMLSSSYNAEKYDFYRITVNIDSLTTKEEEDMVSEYLERFNTVYIDTNKTIQSAFGDDRQYYVVKTIYNFLAKNTVYDMDVYTGKIAQNDERYRYSHTAYGTLFGNTEGAYNPASFDISKEMTLDYQTDSQGLYRIHKRNQGRSVCDGYSLVFYYLCKLNGIDCHIVIGDNVGDKASDPHAWNMVYLKDYNDEEYVWYAVDTTFACQKSQKISDVFSIIDYSYFLRGTDNERFSVQNHQQLYNEYTYLKQSKTDYEFEISDVKEENLYTVVTRRRDADSNLQYIDTGEYNLEDYLIIAPDGNCYKASHDNEHSFIETEGFEFYSRGYYYSCEFYDFAKGIEYTCDDRFIRDAGKYEFDIVTTKNNIIYKKNVLIATLDMSDWSNYDLDLTKYPEKAGFIGKDIIISADVYDNSGLELKSGIDYNLICYVKGDSKKVDINPYNPGSYIIRITYKGNYSGFIEVPFSVAKADLSDFAESKVGATFGADIAKSCASFKIGDTVIKSGTDYKVDVVGGLNYGDQGKIVITGLSASKYVKAGSVTKWDYTVDKRYNISSLFNNKYITNAKYKYTGKAIKPTDFTLSYVKSDTNQKIKLVRDKDYVIKSYSDNVNAGTGKVKIEFIGNYSGTATMMFYIEYGKLTITCSDLTYNGKSQAPNPVVKVGDAVMKKGTHYKVSGKATNPGVYQGTVTGIGDYSKISGTFVYYIKPGKLSGVKSSATQNSISVSWSKQGNNCIYEIWVYDTGLKGWKKLAQTSGASYKFSSVLVNGKKTAIKPNTQYKIKVRAVLKGTVNGKSIVKNGDFKELTVRTVPKTLTCKVARSGSNALRLTWNKDTSVTGYQVYLSTSSNFKSGTKSVTINKNANYAYTFKNLKKGKTYYLRVRSFKKVGDKTYYSAYSSTAKIKL